MRAAQAFRWTVAVRVACACAAASAQSAQRPQAPTRFDCLGVGPAAAGQTVQQAKTALGAASQPMPPAKAGAACERRSTARQPGVSYVVDRGIVTSMETRDARYLSVSGVRVGDDVVKVRQVYGKRLSSTPHACFAQGLTLAVCAPDRKHALVMESNDAGRIVTLRGGLVPVVEFLEARSG